VPGKMRRLRRNIKGWDINIEGEYKKEKKIERAWSPHVWFW
jgi:hypothetical protein